LHWLKQDLVNFLPRPWPWSSILWISASQVARIAPTASLPFGFQMETYSLPPTSPISQSLPHPLIHGFSTDCCHGTAELRNGDTEYGTHKSLEFKLWAFAEKFWQPRFNTQNRLAREHPRTLPGETKVTASQETVERWPERKCPSASGVTHGLCTHTCDHQRTWDERRKGKGKKMMWVWILK
jgi:hypothetical protein